jgi:hypothetical protein
VEVIHRANLPFNGEHVDGSPMGTFMAKQFKNKVVIISGGLRRIGQPSDTAGLALFLCSTAGSHILIFLSSCHRWLFYSLIWRVISGHRPETRNPL